MKSKNKQNRRGFTLIEAVVGVTIFAVLALGILQLYSVLTRVVKVNRERVIITTLSDNYLEIVRNLPYSEVGTLSGNPSGALADTANPVTQTIEGINYEIFYEVTYIDDPADGLITLGTDPAPNDYKQVKMNVKNTYTSIITAFVTNISSQGLESLNNAGAIMIKVFDATGQPVSDATIHIENLLLIPNIVLNRGSDPNGDWVEVGLPASVNGYHIVVTKPGYSSDQTYPITVANPNPVKPDVTVVNGQVTQVSFVIDLLANLTIKTLDQNCQNLSGIGVNVRGAKLIGVTPDVFKYNIDHTSSNGSIILSGIEWDNYTPTLLPNQGLMVYGTSPIQSVIDVLPGSNQIFTLILGPQTTNSLLVIVKDSSGTPLEGANVHLIKGGSVPQDYYGTTGGSVWVQKDWTAGSGQVDFVEPTKYFADDGLVDIVSVPTGVRLLKITGRYVPSGTLESSTFDTGTASTNYTTLTWQPTSQDPATTLKFQIASNNDNTTWNFIGPDGTADSYYTVPGTTLNSAHNNDRYIRYKTFLATADDKLTPTLTRLDLNYISGCFTPGQVIFTNLTSGNNYDLEVSLPGFQNIFLPGLTIDGNSVIEVIMTP